jgi:hypothetical protein
MEWIAGVGVPLIIGLLWRIGSQLDVTGSRLGEQTHEPYLDLDDPTP